MPEVSLLALALTGGPGSAVTPVDAAANSVLTYWFSFGAIAVVAFALFFLFVWPGKLTEKNRRDARADLLEEHKRLLARCDLLEQAVAEKDKALGDANARADAAVRASELIADAFTEARHRRSGGRAGSGHAT